MFFNFRHPIILLMLSLAGLMIGMAFKVMHWPGGQLITGSMIMVQVIAIIWLIIIVIRRGES